MQPGTGVAFSSRAAAMNFSRKQKLSLLVWGGGVALACFLLMQSVMTLRLHSQLLPLSPAGLDSLIAVTLPGTMSDTLLRYSAFSIHFNSERHIANCAFYQLTRDHLNGSYGRPDDFAADAAVPGCALLEDYAGSGYDRGHLVPAADVQWSAQALRESFLLTNVCAQTKKLNGGGWAKLEEKVREWAARDSALVIFTGPAGNDVVETIGTSRVAVPRRFYKIIVAPCVRPMRAVAFIYPNGLSGKSLSDYCVNVDSVERATGIDFFSRMPQPWQRRIEGRVNLDAWLN